MPWQTAFTLKQSWNAAAAPVAGSLKFEREARLTCGLDLSSGMLAQARSRSGGFALVQAVAWQLPFPSSSFDLIFCVHAFHHFGDQPGFIQRAYRLLRPGGALAIIGMDPHSGRDRYYIYDYFEGTRETDLQRFAPSASIADWMSSAGFSRVERSTADWISRFLHR